MSGGGGSSPQAPNYYQEILGQLAGQVQLAPAIYQTQAYYDPLYASLNNQLLSQSLFGTAGGSQAIPQLSGVNVNPQSGNVTMTGVPQLTTGGISAATTPSYASPFGAPAASAAPRYDASGRLKGPGGPGNISYVPPMQAPTAGAGISNSISTGSSPGLLSLLGQAGTMQRQQNISDWSNLSPSALAAIKASNPQLASLIDTMTSQAGSQLGLGTNIDPTQMALTQQAIRSRQSGMLGGTGNAGTYNEALGLSQFGQQLYQQRLANAGNVANINQGIYGQGISNLMTGTYNPYQAVSMGTGLSQFNIPNYGNSNINAQSAADTGYAGQLSAYNSAQNNQSALLGAGISGLTGIGAARWRLARRWRRQQQQQRPQVAHSARWARSLQDYYYRKIFMDTGIPIVPNRSGEILAQGVSGAASTIADTITQLSQRMRQTKAFRQMAIDGLNMNEEEVDRMSLPQLQGKMQGVALKSEQAQRQAQIQEMMARSSMWGAQAEESDAFSQMAPAVQKWAKENPGKSPTATDVLGMMSGAKIAPRAQGIIMNRLIQQMMNGENGAGTRTLRGTRLRARWLPPARVAA